MATPMICEEMRKPRIKQERPAVGNKATKPNVRPNVQSLIKRVIKENSTTWQELANR